MAARFPVSATSVAYQIKAAWASKIHVVYWPAGADSLHRLRTGETVTTIITRATSGATYNATEGRLEGTSTVYFRDSIAGGYGALTEEGPWAAGGSAWGDLFDGVSAPGKALIASADVSIGDYIGGFYINAKGPYLKISSAASYLDQNYPFAENNNSLSAFAIRYHATDDVSKRLRTWADNVERTNNYHLVSNTNLIGSPARELYLGGSNSSAGKANVHPECMWFGAGTLTNAEMALLSVDPSQMIEASGGGGSSPVSKIIQQMGL